MAKKGTISVLDNAVMTEKGLTLNGVVMHEVVEKCDGCERVVSHESGGKYCTTYPVPERKWAQSVCNFATHVRAEKDSTGTVKVNPLKASKRAARGR